MLFSNVKYFGSDFKFHIGDVLVEDGEIISVTQTDGDGKGGYLLPGLIDIHFHGNSGADFSDGDYEGLKTIAKYHAEHGVTSFSPASMTLPEAVLEKAYKTAVQLRDEAPKGLSKIVGITMEGPFFNEKKKGAQAAEHLRLPDKEMFARLNKAADGMIRIACIAPELEGAVDFIQEVSKVAVCSEAHTDANYDEAAAGFEAGARHVTHLYNAMPALGHRTPGVIGAAAERDDVTAELICDGVHIHRSAVRAAFKMFGEKRICLISDSLSACGMADGMYQLGGQDVIVKGNRATLKDGTLAGSATPLFDCMKTAISFGIPMEDAVRCASYNPATVMGIADKVGTVAAEKCADLILTDDELNIKEVYINGEKVG